MYNIGYSVRFNNMGHVVDFVKEEFNEGKKLNLLVNNKSVELKICSGVKSTNKDFGLVQWRLISCEIFSEFYVLTHEQIEKVDDFLFQHVEKYNENVVNLTDHEYGFVFSNIQDQSLITGLEVINKYNKIQLERKKLIELVNFQHAMRKGHKLALKKLTEPLDLENEMIGAGLNNSEIAAIKANAELVCDYKNFLMTTPDCSQAVIIGLNKHEIVTVFKQVIGSQDYADAYEEFYHDFKAKEDFMERLTNTDKKIIFLVPENLMHHPRAGVTKQEMEWLLANQEQMKKVTFIFGVYGTVSKKSFSKTPYVEYKLLKTEYKETFLSTFFTDIKKNKTIEQSQLEKKLNLSEISLKIDELTETINRFNFVPRYTQTAIIDDIE